MYDLSIKNINILNRKGVKELKNLKVFVSVFILCISCSTVINKNFKQLDKGKIYAVLPFKNYTETPMAGHRVASVIEAVLASKGYFIAKSKEEDGIHPEADYVIRGTVNEYGYKAGLEGKPVVSISFYIYDAKTEKPVYSGSISATGWSHESVSTLLQRVIDEVIR